MRIKNPLLRTVAGLSLLGTVACGSAEPGAPDDSTVAPGKTPSGGETSQEVVARPSTLLLKVELEAGHYVTFYEAEPGAIFATEQIQRGQTPRLAGTDATDLLDMFELLRPGQAVPQALLDARQRELAYRAVDAVVAEARELSKAVGGGGPSLMHAMTEADVSDAIHDPNVGVARQAHSSSSAQDFVNNHVGCRGGTVYSACRVNWGGGFFAYAKARNAQCGVDHYAGDGVLVRLQSGSAIFDHYLDPGVFLFYINRYLPDDTIIRRFDVLNATGDAFHVGCYWGASH